MATRGQAAAGPLGAAWGAYFNQLQRNPLRTKALTSSCVAGLSDAIAQSMAGHGRGRGSWVWGRTGAIMLYGLLWNGPGAHYWQKLMEVVFQGKSDLGTVLKKVVVDQLTYGPLCNILFMSFATLVLEGKSAQFLSQKVRRDYPLVQLNGWKMWIPAALINYAFVPLQFRVLFANLVALCWSIFLLHRARSLASSPPKNRGLEREGSCEDGGAKDRTQ